ncbi:MAG: HAMP domain-containing protein [Spirochaetes bacterium]|nr:HAMP domain-containing protein [Spirochaetota bacterium]
MRVLPDIRLSIAKIKSLFLSYSKKAKPIDYVIIIGLLFFCSIVVIGLFPRVSPDGDDYYFVNILMTVPIIIALYLIFVSFKRRAQKDYAAKDASIRTKIALVFMSIAILPSLPVIIATNSVVNRGIGNLISSDTREALDHGINLASEKTLFLADEIGSKSQSLKMMIDNNIINPESEASRRFISDDAAKNRFVFLMYDVKRKGQWGNLIDRLPYDSGDVKFSDEVGEFLRVNYFSSGIELSRISVKNNELIVSSYYRHPYLFVYYREIPDSIKTEIDYLRRARMFHNDKEALLPAIKSGIGIFLLIISLAIVGVSSVGAVILAKNITRPVFELAKSAEKVAKGDFDIVLERKSMDELGYLFNSFNQMVSELKETREKTAQIERLKAWNQVSRRLIHEIKNPLTPIRLSAERMKRKLDDENADIKRIVSSASETIIEEVDALQHIMKEFTDYARLPEADPKMNDLNELILSCVKFYEGHEKIRFVLELDEKLQQFSFDKHLLRQAFINLIKNSIEAMDYSGTIVIATGIYQDNIKIFFKDTGCGIDENLIANIFEPTFTRKIGGSGLGLAIVKKIIYEHNGSIECRSPLNEGAEFEITLPLKVNNG